MPHTTWTNTHVVCACTIVSVMVLLFCFFNAGLKQSHRMNKFNGECKVRIIVMLVKRHNSF